MRRLMPKSVSNQTISVNLLTFRANGYPDSVLFLEQKF